MNKQDRQNTTIFKRERNSSCLPAPSSPFANVTIGESSTPSRKQGLDKLSGTTRVGLGKGARARREPEGSRPQNLHHLSPERRTRTFPEQSWVLGRQCG